MFSCQAILHDLEMTMKSQLGNCFLFLSESDITHIHVQYLWIKHSIYYYQTDVMQLKIKNLNRGHCGWKSARIQIRRLDKIYLYSYARRAWEYRKGNQNSVNRRRTDNTMAKRKRTKGQTRIYKTLYWKLKIE